MMTLQWLPQCAWPTGRLQYLLVTAHSLRDHLVGNVCSDRKEWLIQQDIHQLTAKKLIKKLKATSPKLMLSS